MEGFTEMRRLIIALTGATGAIYGIRLLEVLRSTTDLETHLIISEWGERTITMETDYSVEDVIHLANYHYPDTDLAAAISSGSFLTGGMIVVPASMKSVAGIACGFSSSLIIRAAEVTMKEKRRLIVVPRETPFSTIDLQNLLTLSRAGVVILPPVPGFYIRPAGIMDIVDYTVGKILDSIGITHKLFSRWGDN